MFKRPACQVTLPNKIWLNFLILLQFALGMVCQIMLAAITSATLVVYDIITNVNMNQIIEQPKLGNERRRCWEKRGEKQSLEI